MSYQSQSQGSKTTQENKRLEGISTEGTSNFNVKSRRVKEGACGEKQGYTAKLEDQPGGLPNALRWHKHDCYVTGIAVLVAILSKYFVIVDK